MGYDDYMMELEQRGFGETDDQAVCLDCILDDGLREQVARDLTELACSFCGRETVDGEPIAASFDVLMECVIDAIRFRYERSVDTLYWEDDFTPRYTSEEVIENICVWSVSDEVLETIKEVIIDEEWCEDPGTLRPDVAFRYSWRDFRNKVKHQTRFVFLSIPEETSGRPDDFSTAGLLEKLVEIITSRGALTEAPAGRKFYRGRMTDEPKPQDYDAAKLGSPPLMKASANRMSPAGISMFYGCDDIPTVVAEIGSHTSKRYAVVGEFETTRALQLVDLVTLPPIPSIFDQEKRESYYELLFLHHFANDLSASVTLDGREHIEYVPTQVITEYMRWLPAIAIDGILYKSAQNGGTCCVIFCGPDGCADAGKETDETMLRLMEGSVAAVRVVAGPVEP